MKSEGAAASPVVFARVLAGVLVEIDTMFGLDSGFILMCSYRASGAR